MRRGNLLGWDLLGWDLLGWERLGWGSACATVVSLGLASPARAETYTVGPDQPYTQFSDLPPLAPGDVVEVEGGNTYAGDIVLDAQGAPGNPIVIRGIGATRPVLSGGTNTIEFRADHYVFENFDITAGSFRCIFHHGHDITVRNSVVHDCPAHGILGADSDSGSLLLEHTEVYGCGAGTQEHQIYMATDETAHPGSVFRMQHCWVHDATGGNSVKSRAERNEIFYNWIEGGYYHELELIGPDGQDESLAREDSDVVGNVLIKRGDNASFYVVRAGGDGTGQTFGRYRFVNNTIVLSDDASSSAVFRLFDGIESIEMHNNVLVRPGGGAVDVFREVEASWLGGMTVIGGSNNWVPDGSRNVPAGWTNTLMGTDPGFTDPANWDLRPLETGPLTNAGNNTTASPSGHDFPNPLALPAAIPPGQAIDVNGNYARPDDGAVDIGAYEYGSPMPSGAGGGGANGAGGASTSGAGAATGASGAGGAGADDGEGGCGCRTAAPSRFGGMAALFAVVLAMRRRRRV